MVGAFEAKQEHFLSYRGTAEAKEFYQKRRLELAWEVAKRWTGLKVGDGFCSQLRPREVRMSINIWYRNALPTFSLSNSVDVKVWSSGETSR